MEKRHQVFVSSTFTDLRAERGEIIQALLELDCFPAGMELFPATQEGAWELIKGVIDDSDYYCLVIGGRYGSFDPDGLGYTEKEYDYAVQMKKPLMAFLHQSPESIPLAQSEKTDEGKKKLAAFRDKVQASHHCKFWTSAEDLGGKVSRSLITLRKTHSAEGWVRGRFASDDSIVIENANLLAKVAQLEAALERAKTIEKKTGPSGLLGGSDTYNPNISFKLPGDLKHRNEGMPTTWNNILRYVGPSLINECSDSQLLEKLNLCFYHVALQTAEFKDVEFSSIVLPHVVRDQIKIQLRALGFMESGKKRRAVADNNVYWKLTPEGEEQLIQVQALKRVEIGPTMAALSSVASGAANVEGLDDATGVSVASEGD